MARGAPKLYCDLNGVPVLRRQRMERSEPSAEGGQLGVKTRREVLLTSTRVCKLELNENHGWGL